MQLCTILEFPDILKRAPKADYGLASFDPEMQSWVTDKGCYDVKFAAFAEDIRCTAPFTVKTAQSWPVHDVLRLQ